MEIHVDKSHAAPVVRVTGDMRLWGKQGLADLLREAVHGLMIRGARHIVLNLAGVNRIDSRGCGCLARVQATAITNNCEISLVLAPGMVFDTLNQLNFVKLYPIYLTEDAALEAADGAAERSAGGG